MGNDYEKETIVPMFSLHCKTYYSKGKCDYCGELFAKKKSNNDNCICYQYNSKTYRYFRGHRDTDIDKRTDIKICGKCAKIKGFKLDFDTELDRKEKIRIVERIEAIDEMLALLYESKKTTFPNIPDYQRLADEKGNPSAMINTIYANTIKYAVALQSNIDKEEKDREKLIEELSPRNAFIKEKEKEHNIKEVIEEFKSKLIFRGTLWTHQMKCDYCGKPQNSFYMYELKDKIKLNVCQTCNKKIKDSKNKTFANAKNSDVCICCNKKISPIATGTQILEGIMCHKCFKDFRRIRGKIAMPRLTKVAEYPVDMPEKHYQSEDNQLDEDMIIVNNHILQGI